MNKKRLPFLIVGILILFVFILMAVFPQAFTSYGRKESFEPWLDATREHILGTNALGYDIFTELVYGAADTLFIGILSGLLSLALGVLIGVCATVKGITGALFNGLINIFVLIPRLIVIMVLAAFLGHSKLNLILLIAFFGWSGTARSVRARVMNIKEQTFIRACDIYGYGKFHTAVFHIVPNVFDVILSRFLVGINSCIMTESTLSFLGLGDIYYPSWGVMINFARTRGALFKEAYGYLLAPCACIILLSTAFYFISVYFEGRRN